VISAGRAGSGCETATVDGVVTGVHRSPTHSFSKRPVDEITLVAGLGVDGDAHCGSTVRHRSRVAADPHQPNLRQVHLLHAELHDELRRQGFRVGAGDLGENITTAGVALLALPTGTLLRIGDQALVALTGLRNPCVQIERFEGGLLAAVRRRDERGAIARLTGVMGVVIQGGVVRGGDRVHVQPPPGRHTPLEPV
jgi:MOSC domain-containing protein YiiM